MLRFRATKGDLVLLAGALGIMGSTLVRLVLDIQIWTVGIAPAIWWAAAIASGVLLWIGVCKTTC